VGVDRLNVWRGSSENIQSDGSALCPVVDSGPIGCGLSFSCCVADVVSPATFHFDFSITSGKSLLASRFAGEQAATIVLYSRFGVSPADSKCHYISINTNDVDDGLAAWMKSLDLPTHSWMEQFLSICRSPAELRELKWQRFWRALELGVEQYRHAFPDRYVSVVFDELTFLLPRLDDHSATIDLKRKFLQELQSKSIRHGHSERDIRFYFLTSSARIFSGPFFGTFCLFQ
jgi:hypothetical protein